MGVPGQGAWRRRYGARCSHGKEIIIVRGSYVRDHFDSDFSQGGNGYRYRFISKGELWVDGAMDSKEWPLVIQHECEESELMKGGMSYDKAHDIAKRHEDKVRRGVKRSSARRFQDEFEKAMTAAGGRRK